MSELWVRDSEFQDEYFQLMRRYKKAVTREERRLAKEKTKRENIRTTCVSCKIPSTGDFCDFCLREE